MADASNSKGKDFLFTLAVLIAVALVAVGWVQAVAAL